VTDSSKIPVIDIFAGPGGLGEGFSAFQTDDERSPFQIRLSVEKDPLAHRTLTLRSFYRQFPKQDVPELYYDFLKGNVTHDEFSQQLKTSEFAEAWQNANQEAMNTELGESTHVEVSKRIRQALGNSSQPWILIGGPPCQAYSLVGRSRNKGIANYRIEDDQRSNLYREYLRIIAEHQPAVFVMENVKGMLSAKLDEQKVFEKILADLQSPGKANGKKKVEYRVVPVVESKRNSLIENYHDPKDFIVACEKYGVPQQRHRVILLGIRKDLPEVPIDFLQRSDAPTVNDVISDLPPLRSGLCTILKNNIYVRVPDNIDAWKEAIQSQIRVNGSTKHRDWMSELDQQVKKEVRDAVDQIKLTDLGRGEGFIAIQEKKRAGKKSALLNWYFDERLKGVCNHQTRGHMDTDLARYLFAAAYAKIHGESPKLQQFASELQPAHESAKKQIFNDRFRVQMADRPSTTITSHISKDGHYFIHPDPSQCRSLTVREAARLQTFPDNYFFCGPRTSQYIQVGNAVPPWIAKQIAGSVWQVLQDTKQVS